MTSNKRVAVCLRTLALLSISFSSALCSLAATETLLTMQTPQEVNVSDGSSANYELGAKFTSGVAGKINAIRFWKSSRETGTHVGHIWSATGQLLASATFASESASGWQQQSLATPLSINSNTVYVVTVNTGNTFYATTANGFGTRIINHDLSSVAGSNGVYGSQGRFPTTTWQASNYFRDVVFTPNVAAGLTSSPATVNLGNVNVGASTSQTLTLTNAATTNVTISKVSPTGTGFTASGVTLPLTLGPGKQASLKVGFAANSMGTANGNVAITSNASNPTLTVPLTAVGMQPQISAVPSPISFGSVALKVSNTQTLTVRNTGNSNLSVSQPTITGTGFTITGPTMPASVTPNNSIAFTARFSPTVAGTVTGSVSIPSNAPHSPLSVALTGTGVPQTLQLSASPSSLAFGNVTDGTSSKQTVTLKNSSNSSVSVSKIAVSGTYFSVGGFTTPVTLAAGQTAGFSVTFAPTTAGAFTGSVAVTSTASNSALSIALSGTGAAASTHKAMLSWTPTTSTVSGYNVYRGTQKGGPYTKITSSLVPGANYSDLTVQAGLTYYYVVTSVMSNGAESVHSSEVSATIP